MERFFGTMLVVVVVGPLFWLGVKLLETWIQRGISLLRQRWRHRKARQAAATERNLLQ